MRYLLEEFEYLVSGQSEETDLVLERSHVVHITHSNLALGKIAPDATHIIDREYRLLIKLLTAPNQDVAKQVAELALRAMTGHIMSDTTHHRAHDAIHLALIRGKKPCSLSIRLSIPFFIYQYTGSLYLCHLEFLCKSRTCHQQHHR